MGIFNNSPLANALMPSDPAQNQQQMQQAAIPLASMVNRISPNAIGLQNQNPTLPWYAVPGMFPQMPHPALAASASTPPPQTLEQQMLQQWLQLQNQAFGAGAGDAGGGNGGDSTGGDGGASGGSAGLG